ncbi:hypothetical protein BN970_03926 [Mycolicibacterium conceptionense]|uniref:Uncharacterized protein n=1 Tax=Mycolicibacterium conceptionense TaxID=451644 RepID=A0A0U1DM01_9MYCO|nr:hypothetical protein BN970_03926 [Mycolicibacterium conceptionense]
MIVVPMIGAATAPTKVTAATAGRLGHPGPWGGHGHAQRRQGHQDVCVRAAASGKVAKIKG